MLSIGLFCKLLTLINVCVPYMYTLWSNLLLMYIVGIFIYDFFMGRELNPRLGPIDLKFFCELRPGLIGWIMLDFSFIAEAVAKGQFPSVALLLAAAFHVLYVADALYHEVVILMCAHISTCSCYFFLLFAV